MKTQILSAEEPGAIDLAVRAIQNGEVIAFPTDTVYGVAAGAFDQQGIERLYEIKGREPDKAIPVLVGDPEQLPLVTAEMSDTARRLAERFWPGPLTLIVPRHTGLPERISPFLTIGVRMPDHPVALAILRRTGPLAVTSANLSGEKNTTNAREVLAQLNGRFPLIIDGGRAPGGSPSTVVDCSGPELALLRAGPISLEQLRAALNL